jgi:pimeloyl-ACP methyl ester carboxylesterase
MPEMLINDAQIHFEEFGSGDKVILSSQKFFFSGCFQELLGRYPYDYHVFLITNRGSGKSEHIYKDYDQLCKYWADDVLYFSEKLGIKKFIYTGISHGTFPGWRLAVYHPEVLEAFVAVAGTPFVIPPKIPNYPWSEKEQEEVVGNREKLSTFAWNAKMPTEGEKRLKKREANFQEHLNQLMITTKEEFRALPTSMFPELSSTEELLKILGEISTPILIINGVWDELSPPDMAVKVTKVIRGSKLIMWEQMEHSTPDECPELIAREFDYFMNNYRSEYINLGLLEGNL